MQDKPVIIIGGGIAGLTAAALLTKEGIPVLLLEAHSQLGGCAGTFKRGPYVFDVGATQVAGLEHGGIHDRIFKYLGASPPKADLLDPGCTVDLLDGKDPINIWHDSERWIEERKRHFPGSERFWDLCNLLHEANWDFVQRDPVLTPRGFWDFAQLVKAIRPINFLSGSFIPFTVADLLRVSNCHRNSRLKRFLDLQLKLYSQETADRTAALYGATVLQMIQAPLGLWHLHGSMQALSDKLEKNSIDNGAKILLKHRVVKIKKSKINEFRFEVQAIDSKNKVHTFNVSDVISTLPPQSLLGLLSYDSKVAKIFIERIKKLPQPQGAIVFYGAIERSLLPKDCPAHIQLGSTIPGSLFLSISREGDGRAPCGQATVIVSAFSNINDWKNLHEIEYNRKKKINFENILQVLESYFGVSSGDWNHKELSTPKSFARWLLRPDGIVGGLGQHPSVFGLFGQPSRTPIKGLWLCGDSIPPGEGTAGVSQSALMVCRQLLAERNYDFNFK
mgnify:CR=1 FL=1|tara:strand:- start:4844 stop:6355 length:1512 start_codon:yes stop_codon:yes gene_type:complete